MFKQHFVLSEQIINGAGLTQRETRDELRGLNSSKGTTIPTYADLSAVHLASLTAMENLLAFGEHGLGKNTVQAGQLMFQTQPELDEYQRLMKALTDLTAREDAVVQRVTALAQKNKQSLVDKLK